MPKIQFIRDTHFYEDSDADGNPVIHEEGETLDCSEETARHFMQREAAIDAARATPAKPKAKASAG